jgi:glycosyltransferase involved in cell wall biosynthesis
MQMRAISELFEETVVCVPVSDEPGPPGTTPIAGRAMRVRALPVPKGAGAGRKLLLLTWLLRSARPLIREIRAADAVHTPIPGDVGTVGIAIAEAFRRPIFVRHCGNWANERTVAERAWKRYMERFGGGRRVMLATGGGSTPPSPGRAVEWIFSTSLSEEEVRRLARTGVFPADGPLRLVTAGRQVELKGTRAIIQALPLLSDLGREVELHVLGDGVDLERFREVARSTGVGSQVIFHGLVSHEQVLDELIQGHIFVFPTRSSEGFPKAVGEAMAAGLPVVTTDVSVLPHLLAKGGGVITDGTPRGIAVAIRGLMETDVYNSESAAAQVAVRELTLERWQEAIQARLLRAWGRHPSS